MTTTWQTAAANLADLVAPPATVLHEAVSVTPRHALVRKWWEPKPGSTAMEWALTGPAVDEPWGKVYSDLTLVTRVGPTHADHAAPADLAVGSPTSSSTMPGLVTRMLQLMWLEPGHQVLDIGTGSGYSAALLAYLLGDDQVTSVDVDPYLVQAAQGRLAAFGRTPQFQTCDVTEALPEGDWDRAVSMVSVRPVPGSWITALGPGAQFVTTIANTPLLVQFAIDFDSIAYGTVDSGPATFMRTRSAPDYAPRFDATYLAARDAEGGEVRKANGPIPDLWSEWELRCLFELDTPDIEVRTGADDDGNSNGVVWLLGADGAWARAEGATGLVHQDGPRRLWDDLERVRAKWEDNETFSLRDLVFEATIDSTIAVAPTDRWTITL